MRVREKVRELRFMRGIFSSNCSPIFSSWTEKKIFELENYFSVENRVAGAALQRILNAIIFNIILKFGLHYRNI